MHHHIAAGEGATPTDRFDLQHEVLKTDRVVAVDRTFELQRESQVQIAAGAGDKGRSALRGWDLEAAIERSDVLVVQKAVGLLDGPYAAQPQLLRQASLPGGKAALRAAPRLRRGGGNHLHAQIAQRPAHLR